MNYPLIKSSWGSEEINALHEVIESGWFTCGKKVKLAEESFAKISGAKFAVMSNSGSSANLLAVASFFYSQNPKIKAGDEVIVPAIGWSTTYSPLQQYGLKLKFVDVNLETLNIDIDQIKAAITPKTKMIVAVNILGNPCSLDEIKKLCQENGLLFFEDNCESMGAKLNNKWCGTFGDIGTFSTFYSHHISTIEGGFSITDSEELYKIMLCLRSHGWSRALPQDNLPLSHYNFLYPGYNLRPTELSAAVAIEQLKKFPKFLEARCENAKYFKQVFKNDSRFITQIEIGESSWFSFAMIIRPETQVSRDEVIQKLSNAGIEARMVTGGNFARHPAIQYYNHEIPKPLINADIIHDRGFFVGNFSIDAKSEIDQLYKTLNTILGPS